MFVLYHKRDWSGNERIDWVNLYSGRKNVREGVGCVLLLWR